MHKRKRYQCVRLQKITKSQRKTVRGINERKKKGNNSQDGNNKYLHVNTLFPTVKFYPSFAAGELAHYLPWLQTLNCNFLCCAVLCLVTQSCLTVATPLTVAHQASLSMGILQAGMLKGVVVSSSKASFQPRD